MTLLDLEKVTTKKQAQRIVNTLREYIQSKPLTQGGKIRNDYDIIQAKEKLRELVMSDCSDVNWKSYNAAYDSVVELIELEGNKQGGLF